MEERKPKVIDIEKKEKEYFEGGGFKRAAISKGGESIDIDVSLATIKPGQTHEWHAHEQDEVMYIVQGSGKYLLQGDEIPYRAGNFVFMPRHTMHKNVVIDEEDLILVAIFNPARF